MTAALPVISLTAVSVSVSLLVRSFKVRVRAHVSCCRCSSRSATSSDVVLPYLTFLSLPACLRSHSFSGIIFHHGLRDTHYFFRLFYPLLEKDYSSRFIIASFVSSHICSLCAGSTNLLPDL
ncbi:hypothetical protein PLICRDRAFT_442611 [Plicaturopsis crispa FD-325 SS-3]|uniref:Secreted protein n=1 Tax=Plicaturopsis crispa FD-325 SS-3 TaxID=944288 RepID=A0A0C9SKI9_PLICR|nr:hypothetical protein PLICRDRAFT_442611 [Plicaturopsis crispa FD-325 SS-3]